MTIQKNVVAVVHVAAKIHVTGTTHVTVTVKIRETGTIREPKNLKHEDVVASHGATTKKTGKKAAIVKKLVRILTTNNQDVLDETVLNADVGQLQLKRTKVKTIIHAARRSLRSQLGMMRLVES